jgi:hypothetical protein
MKDRITHKLNHRMKAVVSRAVLVARYLLGKIKFTHKEAVAVLRGRQLDRAQWRRWYQANRKYQRQLTALKQRACYARPGFHMRIDPRTTGLPRGFVR